MANYQGLEVWQKARRLATHTYSMTAGFPRAELFGLGQQMRRAAVSAVCNVAEAHGRRSSADREHFLLMSRGSLLELETQVMIAGDLEFLRATEAAAGVAAINEVVRLLNGLIRHYARRRQTETRKELERRGPARDRTARPPRT